METIEEKIDKRNKEDAKALRDSIKSLSETANNAIDRVFDGVEAQFSDKKDFIKAKELTNRLVSDHLSKDEEMVESLKKDLEKLGEKTNSDSNGK